jgi:hypothetical protein
MTERDFLNVAANAAGAGDLESAAPPAEPMKRFILDVPVGLHRRVRGACAKRGLRMSNVLRDLLEREFPETGQSRLPP